MNPSGKKNQGKKIQKAVMNKLDINNIESTPITNNVNLTNNLTPSVIGVRRPNKKSAGPILNCTIAKILRSHKLTYPHKTDKTSINITISMHISKCNNNK